MHIYFKLKSSWLILYIMGVLRYLWLPSIATLWEVMVGTAVPEHILSRECFCSLVTHTVQGDKENTINNKRILIYMIDQLVNRKKNA